MGRLSIAWLVGAALSLGLAHAQPDAIKPPPDDIVGSLKVGALNNEPVQKLSRPNDVSTPAIMAANFGVDEILPQTKEQVIVPAAHILPAASRDGIIINRAEYRLYYLRKGVLVRTVPVGIGLPTKPTPLGRTSIIAKKKDPAWFPTAEARREHPDWPDTVEPGITNPLGAYALYLGWNAYLIHGSTNDFGIGRPFTRGCIRVWADDIEHLFNEVPIGTHVEVVDQPVKVGWHEGELFIEAHPDLAQLDELRETLAFTPKPGPDYHAEIAAAAGTRAADIDWQVADAAIARRSGLPTQITSVSAHPVSLFEPTVSLASSLVSIVHTQHGFGGSNFKPQPVKRTPAELKAIEEMRNEQLRKDPYNI